MPLLTGWLDVTFIGVMHLPYKSQSVISHITQFGFGGDKFARIRQSHQKTPFIGNFDVSN